jgi:magnesium and cobalt exporter, CNNM family
MPILPFAVFLLLLCSALLAASETAIFTFVRMEHARAMLSEAVQSALDRLLRRPLESLVVIIGLNETANVFAECLATTFLLMWLGPVGAYVSVPVMLVLVLLFCDVTPKTFALAFPGLVMRLTARPLVRLTDMVHPLARVFTPMQRVPGLEPLSEAEFKALLRMGETMGQVEPGERELINKVFDFGNRRVAEVMTPREKIFSLDIATSPQQLIAEVAHNHFSRIPVYRSNPDNIIGILHAKDLVARLLEHAAPRLDRFLRPTYFVPPGKTLGELFEDMRHDRFQLALVVNEYGHVLGLVTLEDLLEELFGEIRDEFELEVPDLTRVGDNEWLVSGAIRLDKLRSTLDGEDRLPPGAERTFGSLVLRQLGRVPRAGEKFRLGGYEATVERVHGATIELVRLTRWQ